MQIGVVGAGAVGGAIAALLNRSGHDVEVTARGDHLAAIRRDGLRLTGGWGDHTAAVEANEVLTRGAELVIVATKAQHATAAIRSNVRMLRGVPVLIVQNGLDSIANARAASPRSDIVGALATFAASYFSPGVVTITATGPTYLGVAHGESDVPARYVARVFDGVIPATVIPNFVGAQWTKLVINQVNALPAITGLSVQDVISRWPLRRILTASIRETVRVGLAGRVHFETLQKLSHGRLRLFAAMPLWAGQLLPAVLGRRFGDEPNPGSTLQSIRRGQSTEIDYLNGAVVRAAERVARDAPINALLVELVHGVEETGEFLAPTEVASRFSTAV